MERVKPYLSSLQTNVCSQEVLRETRYYIKENTLVDLLLDIKSPLFIKRFNRMLMSDMLDRDVWSWGVKSKPSESTF